MSVSLASPKCFGLISCLCALIVSCCPSLLAPGREIWFVSCALRGRGSLVFLCIPKWPGSHIKHCLVRSAISHSPARA